MHSSQACCEIRRTFRLRTSMGKATMPLAAAAAAAANVKLVEVLCTGWPYVFAVATRGIFPGEELKVDRGQEHWDTSRFALARLRDISQRGRELTMGTSTEEAAQPAEEEPPLSFPVREPMRRAGTKAPGPPEAPPEGEVV
mmetsp:Transcript_44238/g.137189  ORF Transcript_44238/g.137189 Transcript_44238/m.137189 type:complete len:141 (+) Transcript_44238:503-925(+)